MFFHWEVRNGFCTVLSNQNNHPVSEIAWFGIISPENFFFKDKTHNNNGKYDVFQFFWYTMLESTVSKKIYKLFVKKTFEKAQHTLRLWNIRQSIDIEGW